MNQKKRLLVFLFVLIVSACVVVCSARNSLLDETQGNSHVIRTIYSGALDNNLSWTYDTKINTLTINGTGDIKNFSKREDKPWEDYKYEIATVVIDDGITSIGDCTFAYLRSLKSVTIPNTVSYVGDCAFIGCKQLPQINIPSSVSFIGQQAFQECASLTAIAIPPGVTSIESYAFRECSSLTHISIPSTVTSIGSYSFFGCISLQSITIPNTVSSIRDHAFYGCSNLTSVLFFGSVDPNTEYVFANCNSLNTTCVPYHYELDKFCAIDVSFDKSEFQNYTKGSNQCYDLLICNGHRPRIEERINTSEWKSHTNKCIEYICLNESGGDTLSICKIDEICLNYQCVKKDSLWVIAIETKNVTIDDFNETDILEVISTECDIDPENLHVSLETDEDGNIVFVYVYVENEETAQIITEKANECEYQIDN